MSETGRTWFGALSAAGRVAAPPSPAAVRAREALVVPEETVGRLQLGRTEAGGVWRAKVEVIINRSVHVIVYDSVEFVVQLEIKYL